MKTRSVSSVYDEFMRMLTIQQPWAGLIATGIKTIELRSWSTIYRGALAIHAGRAFDKRGKQHPELGKRGHVLCIVDLVDVRPATADDMQRAGIVLPHGGLFAWVLDRVRAIEPKEARGALGLRHAPDWIKSLAC